MKVNEINKKLKPLRDLVAFYWVKPKLESGLVLPDDTYDFKARPSRSLLGKIIAVGPKVKDLQVGQHIMFGEYAVKDFKGVMKEGEVHFIEESQLKIRMVNPNKSVLDYRPPVTKQEVDHLENA